SDGKIVAVGFRSSYTSPNVIALARYNPNGSLDSAFGFGGRVLTRIGSSSDQTAAFAAALQSDGKIVVGGGWAHGSRALFALVRYNPDGSLDSTFGKGGKVVTAIGSRYDVISAISIQSDGKIVAVGRTLNGCCDDFALARYMPSGALDTSFGTNGNVVTAFGPSDDEATAMAMQSAGNIVVAGYTTNSDQSVYRFALARYTASGSLDPTFGTGGRVISAIGGSSETFAYGVALQSDGKIVAAG
ncbi:MAG TPA: hypothetical protein VF972_10785, partial [Actinomycetota bacterium]